MNNIYYITLITIGLGGIVSYIIQSYLRRYYLRGKSVARGCVDAISTTKTNAPDNVEGIGILQKQIFDKALNADCKEFEDKMSSLQNKIKEFENSIHTLREKQHNIENVNCALVDQEGEARNGENFKANIERIDNEIIDINSRITTKQTELDTARQKQVMEALDKQQNGMRLADWLKKNLKFSQLFERLGVVWPYLLLIVIDYALALQFFKDVAQDSNNLVEKFSLSYVLSLAFTMIVILLIHASFDQYRKKRIITTFFLTFASFILMSMMLVLRVVWPVIVTGSIDLLSNKAIIQVVFWIIFVYTVLIIGSRIKDWKNLFEIVAIPAQIASNIVKAVIVSIFVSIFWFFKWVFSPISLSPKERVVNELEKDMTREERKRTKLCKQKKELIDNIDNNNRKGQQGIRNQQTLDVRNNKRLIKINEKEKNRMEVKKQKIVKYLTDLRQGSNDGVIAGLKKIKK